MDVQTIASSVLETLQDKATRLRIDSIRATTEAGSGHPTSCASAAEIVSALFFSVMRYTPTDPGNLSNDVFVLSKGHAAPLLYSAWAEAGAFPKEQLLTLRRIDSELEGHPTPRLPFVDAATGSLGQGLSVGLGIAWNAKYLDHSDERVYVLMGDGESAEGAVWEAAQAASYYGVDNLCAILDANRFGQSQPTMLQHQMEIYQRRWEAFGWQGIIVDGHDLNQLLNAFERANNTKEVPTILLARTLKGKGLSGIEDKDGWHGKPLDHETARKVIEDLESALRHPTLTWKPNLPIASPPTPLQKTKSLDDPPYKPGEKDIATRKAFGDALGALAKKDPRVVALDGDVKNSTYTEVFQKTAPDRFVEGFIAEQNMTGMAMGLAARDKVPFVSTFACFLARAYDFIRMTAISQLNVKFAGTHVGISIGEDGPSQMGLEDIAAFCAEPNFTVLYPSDAVSTWRATEMLAEHKGPGYLRLGRPNAPVLYPPQERFSIGKCKILRQSDRDRCLIISAGVTLNEALAAYEQLQTDRIPVRIIDLFSVQPIDRDEVIASARACNGRVITVEDHYSHGGIGDAVLAALASEPASVHKLAVREIPRSGNSKELLETYGISRRHITEMVKSLCA
jgi:transketolase